MTASHYGPAFEQEDKHLMAGMGHVFTDSIPAEEWWVHRHSALKQSGSDGDKILYLYHYDLRDVRSRSVGTELAAPLTAKTSGVLPAGFVQQNNKCAVKKWNQCKYRQKQVSEESL